MISVRNLSFREILSPISFQVQAGKTVAVIGHNGAGKTTLFHILLKLKFSTSGDFKLNAHRIGYVPERPYLDMEETLFSFLTFHLNLLSMPADLHSDEISRVVSMVGLSHDLKKKFGSFSKGMLQKAMLAQAMLGNPELIFLDEPMSGLDPVSRKDLLSRLQVLRAAGVNLVFSSHVMEEVSELADHVLILDQGKQIFFGSVEEWRKRG